MRLSPRYTHQTALCFMQATLNWIDSYIGLPPDFQRLKKLGNEGVRAMITESTNSGHYGKTPSEQIAKDLVRDVLLGTEETDSGVLITRSRLNVARINAIIQAAEKWTGYRSSGSLWNAIFQCQKNETTLNSPRILKYTGAGMLWKSIETHFQDGKKKYLPIMTGTR